MKRSRAVTLTLVPALAAALIGCRDREIRRCVDEGQAVVDERNCLEADSSGYHGGYHWYYGGPRGYIPMGTRLSGGSSGSAAPNAGTVRGVVGASGEAASGHAASGEHGGGGAGE